MDTEQNSIAVDASGAVPVVALAGEWDLHNAATFRAALLNLVTGGADRVVIDVTDTVFLDSTAIQAIVATVQKGAGVTVRGATDNVLRTLMMAGMDALVAIEE